MTNSTTNATTASAVCGVDMQARSQPLFLLLDTSTSMSGDKIAHLNDACKDMFEELKADPLLARCVQLSVVTFSSAACEALPLTPVPRAVIPTLRAGGLTCLGAAIRLLIDRMGPHDAVPERSYSPTIVLVSDGQPSDDWQSALAQLKAHPRLGRARRLALAVGPDADRKMLRAFATSDEDLMTAAEASEIHRFFSFVTWATRGDHTVLLGDGGATGVTP